MVPADGELRFARVGELRLADFVADRIRDAAVPLVEGLTVLVDQAAPLSPRLVGEVVDLADAEGPAVVATIPVTDTLVNVEGSRLAYPASDGEELPDREQHVQLASPVVMPSHLLDAITSHELVAGRLDLAEFVAGLGGYERFAAPAWARRVDTQADLADLLAIHD